MKRWIFLIPIASLFSPRLVTAQVAELTRMGRWSYQEALDPIDDRNSSMAMTANEDLAWMLGIICMEKGKYLVSIGAVGSMVRLEIIGEEWDSTMTWRVDRQEPITEQWRTNENGHTLLGDQATRFLSEVLRGEERVVLRFGNSAKIYTVLFSLEGARDAIGALNNCN